MSECNCGVCTGYVEFVEDKCKHCGAYETDCYCALCDYCNESEHDCGCLICDSCWKREGDDCECEAELAE